MTAEHDARPAPAAAEGADAEKEWRAFIKPLNKWLRHYPWCETVERQEGFGNCTCGMEAAWDALQAQWVARPAPAAAHREGEGHKYVTFHEPSVDGAIFRLERSVRERKDDRWPTVSPYDLFTVLSVLKDLAAAREAARRDGES